MTHEGFIAYVQIRMGNSKPFVKLACVCEKVLTESDKVVSLIRIVDIFGFEKRREVPGVIDALRLNAFIALVAGDLKGEFEVGLFLRRPDGKATPRNNQKVILSGGNTGANLHVRMSVTEPSPGLYWFDVFWGDELLTSIPFELKITTPEPELLVAQAKQTQPKSD